jgi:TPR repeat protein
VFGKQRPFWGDWAKDTEVEACEADPAYCHSACTQALSGEACFSLGRAMQDNEPETKGRHYEALFTQACALGHAGGCTNRGGGIRNGGYEDDPFRAVDDAERESCLFRTFEVACGEEDAWGCAMLGQAYHRGEGVPADADSALRHYRQSCEISPDFAACQFAEGGIYEITGKDEPSEGEQEL